MHIKETKRIKLIKMIFELQSNFGYIGDIRRILPSFWQQKRPKLKPVLIFWRFRPSIAIIHDHSCSFMLIHIYSKLHSFQTQDILEPHPISRVVLLDMKFYCMQKFCIDVLAKSTKTRDTIKVHWWISTQKSNFITH